MIEIAACAAISTAAISPFFLKLLQIKNYIVKKKLYK